MEIENMKIGSAKLYVFCMFGFVLTNIDEFTYWNNNME